MNEYELTCSVSHHFRGQPNQIDESTYEEQEKQRLLRFPKHERSLWCWICGFTIDPCDYKTPKEGVDVFNNHLKICKDGWRKLSEDYEKEHKNDIHSLYNSN